ncbi:MAG: hypothetical protein M1363_05255 [Gammaproteobacteria bacterium]|nr:hypothetical protein [Gammaproteobacteria bacterium]
MQPLLVVDALRKVYHSRTGLFQQQTTVALDTVSFTLNEGKTLAVMGYRQFYLK